MRTASVVLLRQGAQPGGGLLGGEVALGFGQELEADHELAHRRRAQERRVEVGVELPVCLLYTSDAADALLCVDLGGRRII